MFDILDFRKDYENIYFLSHQKKLDYRGKILLSTIEKASLLSEKNKIFVEIGTFKGWAAKVVLHCLNKLNCQSKFYSIDLNLPFWEPTTGLTGWNPKDEWFKTCSEFLDSSICIPSFIEGDSTIELSKFEDNSLVWCFVDGCHCFDCTLADINNAIQKLCIGGFIVIDDTMPWDKKKSQWYHDKKKLRPFGVDKAIEKSFLYEKCKIIHNANFHHGMQAWQKVR